jgi:hypothetical protein
MHRAAHRFASHGAPLRLSEGGIRSVRRLLSSRSRTTSSAGAKETRFSRWAALGAGLRPRPACDRRSPFDAIGTRGATGGTRGDLRSVRWLDRKPATAPRESHDEPRKARNTRKRQSRLPSGTWGWRAGSGWEIRTYTAARAGRGLRPRPVGDRRSPFGADGARRQNQRVFRERCVGEWRMAAATPTMTLETSRRGQMWAHTRSSEC